MSKVNDAINVAPNGSSAMAGNKVYYVGGSSLVWRNTENETLGLTHPFFHDLRSRGTGIAYYEGVGTGNDFYGWEFHRETKVAYGSVVSEEERWERPAPSQMFWRPDRMVVQYELANSDGEIAGSIKEEKFISSNDVVSTIITSDRAGLKLEVTGQSYGSEKRIVSLDGVFLSGADCALWDIALVVLEAYHPCDCIIPV